MKRLITQLALLIAVLCASIPAHAYDCKVDGIYYNINKSDNTAEVTKGEGDGYYEGAIKIPRSIRYNGSSYSVTSIGEEAFYDCRSLSSVTIPNSVTSIGYAAFEYCRGLSSVTIPNSVTSIGMSAFYGCSGLKSLTIPASVTSIGKYAFYDCSGLTSIVVDKGNINYDSRDNCNAIIKTATNTLITGCNSTIIPNSVTSIGDYAFYGCSGLASVTIGNSVTIPESVTSIGESAFYYCTGLTSVTIGNSVTSIGDYAFYGCSGLASVTIGNSVTSIGEWAFFYCSGLTSVTIPNSVTSIGFAAFEYCRGLTSIVVDERNKNYDSRNNCNAIIETATNTLITGCISTFIPNSVTSIGMSAFYGCSGLTSVTIPESVTSIGMSAFYGCSGLKSVTCLAPNPPACGINALTDIDKTECTLYVLKESVNLYKVADQWKDFYNISEYDGVDDITMDADDAETLYDVYNVQGVKVAGGLRRADMTDALPHGIYILVSPNGTRKEKI